MKKVKPIIKVLFLFLPLLMLSCKKDPTTGDLIVNARDIEGTSVVSESVYLYNSEADFNNVIYSKKLTTDNSGQVKFSELTPGIYYVDCDFVDQLNNTITITGSGSVSAGYETTITIQP
jgi:hypothetical protein